MNYIKVETNETKLRTKCVYQRIITKFHNTRKTQSQNKNVKQAALVGGISDAKRQISTSAMKIER